MTSSPQKLRDFLDNKIPLRCGIGEVEALRRPALLPQPLKAEATPVSSLDQWVVWSA